MDLFTLHAIDGWLVFYAWAAFVSVGLILVGAILLARAKLLPTTPCELEVNGKSLRRVLPGVSLLSALLQLGVPLPSPCGGKAVCKQCKVQILSGGGEPLEVDRSSFTPGQIQQGWRLACQCRLRQDMKIHVDERLLHAEQLRAKVVSNDNVATFIKELIVELPEPISYRSGSYMQLHVPPFTTHTNDWKATLGERYRSDWQELGLFGRTIEHRGQELIRAYSLGSYAAEGAKLIFNIRIATPPIAQGKLDEQIPWGVGSSYAFGLKAGDTIHLSGPYGESLMIDDERELLFLIGGAGSSFARSHILHLFRSERTQRRVTLWYGARSLKENIYQSEYEQLEREFPNFHYRLVLSSPSSEDLASGWPKEDPLKSNLLFRAFELGQLSSMKEPESALFYVCGPALHNQSVMKLLDQYGVPRESIILDDFGS